MGSVSVSCKAILSLVGNVDLALFQVNDVTNVQLQHFYARQDARRVLGKGRNLMRVPVQLRCNLFQLLNLVVNIV